MASILCPCGELLDYSDIPCSIEWLVISDDEFDTIPDGYPMDKLYTRVKRFLKCNHCQRLSFFWNGFGAAPTIYTLEK